MAELDFETLGELRHPEYVCFYPQSGERFIGHDKWVAAHVDYESRFGSDQHVEAIKGGRQRATVRSAPSVLPFSSTPIIQVSDTGDLVIIEGSGRWPDGKVYYFVQILEYENGLVRNETEYFAEPFDAPEWRAEFTERGRT